ncbi:MAG: hypothetical protein QM604_11490 [Microbacterium sp.]
MLQSLARWSAPLVLGRARLPALARGIGGSTRILGDESGGPVASRTDADLARDELAARSTATPVTRAMPAVTVPAASDETRPSCDPS